MVFDIDVIRLVKTIKTKTVVPRHMHEEYFHYICVLSGSGIVEIDGRYFEGMPNTVFAIPPMVKHTIYGLEAFCVIDVKFLVSGSLKDSCMHGNYTFKDISNYEIALIIDMFDEAITERPNSTNMINAKMIEFLMYLIRRTCTSTGKSLYLAPLNIPSITGDSYYLQAIQPALIYIEGNLCKTIMVNELSKLCGFSDPYFSSVFKRTMGVAPKKYINTKKIELAKKLILSSGMNISEISDYLGFDSIHYFSRTFKRITGIPPIKYLCRVNSNMGINIKDHDIAIVEKRFENQFEALSDEQCIIIKRLVNKSE